MGPNPIMERYQRLYGSLLDAKACLIICGQYAQAHEDKDLQKTIEDTIGNINGALHPARSDLEEVESHFCSEESTDIMHSQLEDR